MSKDFFTENNTFIVRKDWENIVNCLESDEEVGILFRSLFAFASRGETPAFSGALKVAFIVMSHQIQVDGEKWQAACEARSEAGKKGGRPPKPKPEEKPKKPNGFSEKQTKAKKPNGFFENQMKAKKPDKEEEEEKDKEEDKEGEREKEKVLRFAPPQNPKIESFGQYKNVKLTSEQYNKLLEDFGKEKTAEYIRRVDEYTQQHAKSYSDYNLTIRKWIYEDAKADNDKDTKKRDRDPSFNIDEIEEFLEDKFNLSPEDFQNKYGYPQEEAFDIF